MKAFILILALIHSVYAGYWGDSWFNRGGSMGPCLINPALLCPSEDYGPSEPERAQRGSALSNLEVSQANVLTLKDSNFSVREAFNNLNFRMWLKAPYGTSIGLGVAMPYPDRRHLVDSFDIAESKTSGYASLLLASDLLGLGHETDQARNHYLTAQFEIPVASSVGLWSTGLEWVWTKGLRLRTTLFHSEPKQTLEPWDLNYPVYHFSWQENGIKALAALRLGRLDLGLHGGLVRLDSSGKSNHLSTHGSIYRYGASTQYARKSWKWTQLWELQKVDRQMHWQESTEDSVEAWSFNAQDKNLGWNYSTSLSRNFGNWRVRLHGERRVFAGDPSQWSIQLGDSTSVGWINQLSLKNYTGNNESNSVSHITRTMGTEIRYWNDGFFLEPGVFWAQGFWNGQMPEWNSWGMNVMSSNVVRYDALIPALRVGFGTGGNQFQYMYRQAFPFAGEPWKQGLKGEWGAMHQFVVTGGF